MNLPMSPSSAELLVDTARAPVALGTRAPVGGDRYLVYRCRGLQVDLMLQWDGGAVAFLWGQVWRALSGKACCGAAVTWLDHGRSPAGEACADEWGEFRLAVAHPAEGALRVSADAETFDCWFVPWESAAGPRDAGASTP